MGRYCGQKAVSSSWDRKSVTSKRFWRCCYEQSILSGERNALRDGNGTSSCSWLDQANCADKSPYRHSFIPLVVYYRQSCGRYLAKYCADNGTVPITRRRYVAGDCHLAGDTDPSPRSGGQNDHPLYPGCPPLCHLVTSGTSWS